MCVAIHKPAGIVLTKDDIEQMYLQNSDGFGAAWIDNGKLHTYHALPSSPEEAWTLYKTLALRDLNAVLHYRMATHGSVRVGNSHPFPVTDDIAMVHNGVLDTRGLKLDCGGDRTDTEAYIDAYLRPLLAEVKDPIRFIQTPQFKRIIAEHIGFNKFVFLCADGSVSIINRQMGVDVKTKGGKFWASNTHWQKLSMYSHKAPKRKNGNACTLYSAGPAWDDEPMWRNWGASMDDMRLLPYERDDVSADAASYRKDLIDLCHDYGVNSDEMTLDAVSDYVDEMGYEDADDELWAAAESRIKLQALVDDIALWSRTLITDIARH